MFGSTLVMMVLMQTPIDAAKTLSGQVVDAQGQPAAGVEVMLSAWGGTSGKRPVLARTKTDRDGRFRIETLAEKKPGGVSFPESVWAYDPQAGLAGQALPPSSIPAQGSVQLKLGGPAHTTVRVRGPDGKPVARARVTPSLLRVAAGAGPDSSLAPADALAERIAAKTGTDGKGEIKGCRAGEIQAVSVEAPGFGSQFTELTSGAGDTSEITLKPAGRLIGRVQADDPSAVRGLEVVARTLTPVETAPPRGRPGVRRFFLRRFGEASVTTNAQGRFEIPALAVGQLALGVLLSDGMKLRPQLPTGLTIEAGKTTEATITLVGPAHHRTVKGRILNLQGQPVADVLVFQSGDSQTRTETKTRADGRFELSGVIPRPTFLFARKPGYRFAGQALMADSNDVTLVIHKTDEPPRLVRKTLPPLLPREQELAVAQRLIDPYAERVLKEGGEAEKVRTLEVLARIEPERVLELVGKKVFPSTFLNSMIGLRVASAMMEDSLDEALTVLEGLEDPGARAIGFIEASQRLGEKDRAKAIDVLDRALLSAKAAKEPDGMRLLLMGQVAERFLDLGQTERGRAILREGEAVAKQLPVAAWVGYARGAFAEELVQIDRDAALELIKDLTDPREFDRHHGNVAHELAGRDPAQAERILAMMRDKFQREQYTVRVVYRMAPLDLERARRLAEAITDDGLKGYALGMMALRLAETGKAPARQVLASAYESLERSSRATRPRSSGMFSVTAVAGVLLPVAERIDPGLVDEYLWRSLAMRPPKPWETDTRGRNEQADVQLAMMIARYDREIAHSLIEGLTRGKDPAMGYILGRESHVAAAAIDPKWAVALVEALPDDPDVKLQHPKNTARLAVAGLLGRAGAARFRKLQHSYVHLWVPDVEDIDPND